MADETVLGFELDEQFVNVSSFARAPVSKGRRKAIGLDELLKDHFEVKRQTAACKRKHDSCSSSDDEAPRSKEALLSQFVAECQKQVHEMPMDEEIQFWGLSIFGNQKEYPSLSFPVHENFQALQLFMKSGLNHLVGFNIDNGKDFLEELLLNGWLKTLVFVQGHVEDSIAFWCFNLFLYSPIEKLQSSASDFWLSILSSNNQDNAPLIEVEQLLGYSELKEALDIYGYVPSTTTDRVQTGKEAACPPCNVRSWLKYLSESCKCRHARALFSASEVEDLLSVVVSFFLDRRLQVLTLLLEKCLLSLIRFFTADEWNSSSRAVAKSLAKRIPMDMNCLRSVECIPGINLRSKQLRSDLAFCILENCFLAGSSSDFLVNGENILRSLISIKIKERGCDFVKVYIYMVLVDNWLSSSCLLEKELSFFQLWERFLQNCSCSITSTDWRSYASKVRSRASYILQTNLPHVAV